MATPDPPTSSLTPRHVCAFRVAAIVALVLVGFLLALAGGGAIGYQVVLAQARARMAPLPANNRLDLPGPRNDPSVGSYGSQKYFDPEAFPGEGNRFAAPPREEPPPTEGELTDQPLDGIVIEETPTGDDTPVDLLGEGVDPEGDHRSSLFDLAPPEESADETEGDTPAPSEERTYRIYAGSYQSRASADSEVSNLISAGYPARLLERNKADGTIQFQVMVGSYDSRKSAEDAATALKAAGFSVWIS